jgi:pimeloyl-ACP methyl ester carboxylesterase
MRSYRQVLHAALQRLDAAPRAELPGTRFGTIEYAEDGGGPAALVSHPLFGGFDVGVGVGRSFLGPRYRLVAPSRFGYLGSTLPPAARPADQADAYVLVLDKLAVDQVTMFGYSGGGPSAIQFALRHPDRTSALVLLAPALPGKASVPPEMVARMLFGSDLFFWLLSNTGTSLLGRILGMPRGFRANDTERETISTAAESLFPIAPRKPGVLFDLYVSNPDVQSYPLEELRVPTLIINARDDAMSAYDNAVNAQARIADAQLLSFDRGGHLLLGVEDLIRQRIGDFIESAASP